MKKVLCSLLMVPILLTGCGKPAEKSSDDIKGIITVITDRTDADELFSEMEENFKKKYPKVEDVVFESAPDYDKTITTRLSSGDYGDVLLVPFSMNGNPKDYENFFEPLGNVKDLEKDYLDVTEADYNGVAYGLPVALNSLGILYNEEVLKKAGVLEFPTSTEEFVKACEKIKETTGVTPFFTNYKRAAVWGGALTSYGGEQYRSAMLEKGTAFKEGQPIRGILDLFYELSSKKLIEADPITGDYAKAQQMLANGEVAMFMMGSQEVEPVQKLVANGSKINIASFPVQLNGKSSIAFGAPGVIGISKNSDNKATARAFLDFFVSAESGYAKDLGGMSPSKKDLTPDQKKQMEESQVILTVPTEEPETDKLYSKIANEAGVGRLTDPIQKVINIGLYPDKNESYESYINSLEAKWEKAVSNNAK